MRTFLILLGLFFSSIGSSEVIPALAIPLDLSRSGLTPQDLSVIYTVQCSYPSLGVGLKKNRSCGVLSPKIEVTQNGVLKADEVDLAGLSSSLLENMSVRIEVKANGNSVFTISADRKREIQGLPLISIYVMRIEPCQFDFTINGNPLLGSNDAQRPMWKLYLHVISEEPRPDISGVWGYLWSLDQIRDFGYANYGGKNLQLKDVRNFQTPVDYYASTKPLNGQMLELNFEFGPGEGWPEPVKIKVPLSENALDGLGTINFKY